MAFAMVVNAQRYDWGTWLMGIMRSVIQGGAAAVVGAFSVSVLAPNTFNFTTGFWKTIELMIAMFVMQGLIHMMMFLQVHSIPELVTTKFTETDTTVTKEGVGGVVGLSATTHTSTVETTSPNAISPSTATAAVPISPPNPVILPDKPAPIPIPISIHPKGQYKDKDKDKDKC